MSAITYLVPVKITTRGYVEVTAGDDLDARHITHQLLVLGDPDKYEIEVSYEGIEIGTPVEKDYEEQNG